MKAALEKIANVATIVTCCVVCFVLTQRWTSAVTVSAVEYKQGEAMDALKDVSWGSAPETLVMFVRSSCHFCTESMPLYREIAESAQHHNGAFRIVIVSGEPVETSTAYVKEHSVAVDEVVSVRQGETRFTSTPTLVLVGRDGRVKQAWKGALPSNRASELLKALGVPATTS